MKPYTPKPDDTPSPPRNDPHSSTEEIGRAEVPNTPQAPKDRRHSQMEEEQRVNNSVHDGEKSLKR
ncbi:hypothetical protein SAMN04487974_1423 [Pelagibacterium luteolum]|uniref:Uncharacterized protein n=1 Tax=Pelagibacterium luteolum TaxID=440168 RepID=A0A1G8AUQ5_9HYPH|nr:hypothetical protein SAMN04487974_1423 [Pelagibacterium luteolum]